MLILHCIIVLLLMGAKSAWAGHAELIDLSRDAVEGELLGQKTYWYSGEEPIEIVAKEDFEGKFIRGESTVINHGYTSSNFWYRLRFYNPSEQSQKIYLHDPHNVYDVFEVYREKELIAKLRFEDTLHQRIVSIELPAKVASSIYIRKKTNAVVHQSTFTFWKDYEALRSSIHASELRFQTVATSLLMSVFLTLSLFFAYRRKIYFYYLGYLLSFVMFATWVWSVFDIPFYSRFGGVVSQFCVLFTALFVDEFLEIKKHSSITHRLFQIYAGLSLVAMSLELVNPILRAYTGTILSIIIQASTVWVGFSLFFRYRQTHILIFNIAFGSFLISGFVQLIIWIGLIDSAQNLIMFYGVATENVLMVLAIGHRILVTEADRKQTDNLLVHSFEQLSKVFYPHQILQIREGRMIEETMPVGEKDACILSFQIIGGRALMSEAYAECVENFLVRCRKILMERYDPLSFRSDAYMIREMGDGFLCSIGYPFQQIGRVKADSAVELAEKLIKEFENLVISLDSPKKIYCSIGIVHGPVKSYFSRSGRIRDDLWGRAIGLASAYEEASLQIFTIRGKEPDSIVILQDAVYESLSRENRQGYEVLEFTEAQHVLGKDLDGECLAYRIINDCPRRFRPLPEPG